MKAFVLAAGLGTRLKPWTLTHPKALVPVGGVPMLRRVIDRLNDEGFSDITVNVHHFGSQIIDFINREYPDAGIRISDETECLLDTGGAILAAGDMLAADDEPILVHNVDILSDAPLRAILELHRESGRDISLVTSPRASSRKLVFNPDGRLEGWHRVDENIYRPAGFTPSPQMHESAFSGIYVLQPVVIRNLAGYSAAIGSRVFPIMDYLIENPYKDDIGEIRLDSLNLIDIGKPDNLQKAESLFRTES